MKCYDFDSILPQLIANDCSIEPSIESLWNASIRKCRNQKKVCCMHFIVVYSSNPNSIKLLQNILFFPENKKAFIKLQNTGQLQCFFDEKLIIKDRCIIKNVHITLDDIAI